MTHDPLTPLEDDPVGNSVHHPYAAFSQGWDAYYDGHDLNLNPYREGSTEHRWWAHGWVEAQDEDRGGGAAIATFLAALLAQTRRQLRRIR